jgi:DNA mismatch endonuclease (patch repair protein)
MPVEPVSDRNTPPASSPEALRRMRSTRQRDTAAEVALRSALHRRGLRFFVDRPPLRGLRRRADVVFPRARVAVYVDGCFWHSCPIHATAPKANADWWREKLRANQDRDRDMDRRLRDGGWTVVRVWEHEDSEDAAQRVADAVCQSAAGRSPRTRATLNATALVR